MFTNTDADLSKDDVEAEFPRCSLPELYALAENINQESKKSNHLKTLGISPTEARRILNQTLNIMSPTSRTDLGEVSQPVFKLKVVRKEEEEKPPSLTDLLHRSLLTGSPSQLDRLGESQQRLAHYGITPPMHTFPYEIILSDTNSLGVARKKFSSIGKLSRMSLSKVKADRFLFEDRITEYSIIEPGTLNMVGGKRVEILLENLPRFLELKVSNIDQWEYWSSGALLHVKAMGNGEQRFIKHSRVKSQTHSQNGVFKLTFLK